MAQIVNLSPQPKADVEYWLKIVGTVIAVFGVFTYFVDKVIDRNADRKTASFTLIQNFEKIPVAGRREMLSKFWEKHSSMLDYFQQKPPTKRAYSSFLLTALGNAKNSDELMRAIFQQVAFYDSVALCLDHSVCDEKLIKGHFCDRVTAAYARYEPVILIRKKQANSNLLGELTWKFLEKCKK